MPTLARSAAMASPISFGFAKDGQVPELERLLAAVIPGDVFDSLGEPGLFQKIAGSLRIVFPILQVPVVSPEGGRLELRGDQTRSAVQRVHDPFLVDGMGNGLPDAPVLEFLHFVVEAQVASSVGRSQ